MKRRARPHGLIDAIRSERGGMALEASLVLPLFLFVLLFLICLIRMSTVLMALHDTASQTARQTAAHLHPAALAAENMAGSLPALPGLPLQPPGDIGTLAAELAELLPEPAGSVIHEVLQGNWRPAEDMAATAIGRSIAMPLIERFADPAILEHRKLRLERLSLPDLKEREEPYIRLQLAYDFPLGLPFTRRTVTLTAAAEERVWVGDAVPAASAEAGKATPEVVSILSIEPTPLRPGRKAKLVASAAPHQTVSLEVRYKSGTSRARHLGQAAADGSGLVVWEWLVSGNTTPGTWELTVTGAGGAKAGMHFDVRKKGDS